MGMTSSDEKQDCQTLPERESGPNPEAELLIDVRQPQYRFDGYG